MFAPCWSGRRTRAPRAAHDPRRRKRAAALQVEALEDRCLMSADVVLEWNQVLLNTFKADNVLPLYFARDAAIVHGAMYDAVNAIDQSYAPLFAQVKASHGASLEAAAAQAAHDTMAALFPAHQATFDATLAADLADIPPGRAQQGIAVGQAVAQQILAWRSTDGSDAQVTYVPGTAPGDWQPTPPAYAPAVAPQWGSVTPFCIPSDSAFRPPAPPALTSAEYTAAFNEIKSLGALNSTTRTDEQSQIARFWYGGRGTYTANGYWNQIAQQVAVQQGDSLVQNARLFALLNVAQADALFAVFDAKYTYNFWRPVTAIRAADTDGNPDTVADPNWTPFLVTPNHPSYASGHSIYSAAAATVLATFFGSDNISFSLSSDSLPGTTRSYASFSAAAQECADSRVYAGIHWRFDCTVGLAMGNEIGSYIVTNCLLPASPADKGGDAPSDGSGDRRADHRGGDSTSVSAVPGRTQEIVVSPPVATGASTTASVQSLAAVPPSGPGIASRAGVPEGGSDNGLPQSDLSSVVALSAARALPARATGQASGSWDIGSVDQSLDELALAHTW